MTRTINGLVDAVAALRERAEAAEARAARAEAAAAQVRVELEQARAEAQDAAQAIARLRKDAREAEGLLEKLLQAVHGHSSGEPPRDGDREQRERPQYESAPSPATWWVVSTADPMSVLGSVIIPED
jgi:septal ring factor EnvC (AmiA/AmiB activator)